jgi:hypothetical protein
MDDRDYALLQSINLGIDDVEMWIKGILGVGLFIATVLLVSVIHHW